MNFFSSKKNLLTVFILLLLIFSLLSCMKMRNEVRVRNNFSNPVHIIVGNVDFGVVNPVKTTEYKRLPAGEHEITGDVQGKVNFSGRGKYYWTINITSVGGIFIVEDKKK